MQPSELKRMIEEGRYRPEPELIAAAMLERRAVRELLTGGEAWVSPAQAGRTRVAAPERRPRAA